MKVEHLPNMLSILRMVLVPVYVACLYLIGGNLGIALALIVFITASITDYFDGYFARKYNCVTDIGKIIDPLADKLLVSVALISIVFSPVKIISIYPIVIILIRELSVTVLREYRSKKKVYISANNWGKVKTFLQMTGIIAVLLFSSAKEHISYLQANEPEIRAGLQILFWVIVVITVVSGISYLTDLEKKRKNGVTDRLTN